MRVHICCGAAIRNPQAPAPNRDGAGATQAEAECGADAAASVRKPRHEAGPLPSGAEQAVRHVDQLHGVLRTAVGLWAQLIVQLPSLARNHQ